MNNRAFSTPDMNANRLTPQTVPTNQKVKLLNKQKLVVALGLRNSTRNNTILMLGRCQLMPYYTTFGGDQPRSDDYLITQRQ